MNESTTIIEAFDRLCADGRPAALATVVRVSGSAYRRPGARMLVAGDGQSWGGVSGGCLERDVKRRARLAIDSGRPGVVRYDTTDEHDDLAHGVALGCRGVIDILIEPLAANAPGPIPWLRKARAERRPVAMATVIATAGGGPPLASRIAVESPGDLAARAPDDGLAAALGPDLAELLRCGAGGVRRYACGPAGFADVFLERLRPPQQLVLFGAGPDVPPLAAIGRTLGWDVAIVAPSALNDDPLGGVAIHADAAVVVMTHNYHRDARLLPLLGTMPLRYLGVLGPRKRTDELLAALPSGPPPPATLFAPVGLDLGAETPAEIALAVAAEIQAVLRGRHGPSLRDHNGPIHPRPVGGPAAADSDHEPAACPTRSA